MAQLPIHLSIFHLYTDLSLEEQQLLKVLLKLSAKYTYMNKFEFYLFHSATRRSKATDYGI
jgi:hypothetical protein